MADSLKVLMMGGPRTGKTSALAGLVDSMISGEVSKLISVRDVTESDAAKQKLAQKVEHLKETLIHSYGRTIIVDDSKTEAYQRYIIDFAIPGTDGKMSIIFTDANGEFFESGREHSSEICQIVKESDVFVIAIDTPSLMEAVNSKNLLMNEAVNKAINNVGDIHNFITYLDDKNGADAKMVIFVPLKCEKWAREGRLDEVAARVRDVYAVPIQALSNFKNVEVDIIPIQTVGSIVFSEHLKSYLCISGNDSPLRCSLVDGKRKVRFANGEVRKIDTTDVLKVDPQSPIREGSSILRPNSWFTIVSKSYSPHNCEQLAYYILRFVLAKYLFVKERIENRNEIEKRDVLWKIKNVRKAVVNVTKEIIREVMVTREIPSADVIYNAFYYIIRTVVKYFGTINYEQLHNLVRSLNEQSMIKSKGEGICCLKKSLLSYD